MVRRQKVQTTEGLFQAQPILLLFLFGRVCYKLRVLQAKGATNEYLFDGANGGFMCRKCWKNITSFHKLRESLLYDLDGVIAALPIPSEMQEQAAASTVQVGKHPHASTAEEDVSFLAKRPRLAAHGQQPVFIAESSSPGVQVNMTCSW